MRRYHRLVQQAIKMFAERPENRNEFVSVTTGSTIIRIHHPTNGRLAPLEYKPDATIILSNRQKIVFQVLAAQARKNREIEADMMRAFLSPEVSVIVFVTQLSVYAKNVERISEIVMDNLSGYGVKDEMMPITVSLIIPKSIRRADRMWRHFAKIRKELVAPLRKARPSHKR